jgi:hypothetical protein
MSVTATSDLRQLRAGDHRGHNPSVVFGSSYSPVPLVQPNGPLVVVCANNPQCAITDQVDHANNPSVCCSSVTEAAFANTSISMTADIPNIFLTDCFDTYSASGPNSGAGTGVEAVPNTSAGTCPSGQLNQIQTPGPQLFFLQPQPTQHTNFCCDVPCVTTQLVSPFVTSKVATPDTANGTCPYGTGPTPQYTNEDSDGFPYFNYCCFPAAVPAITHSMLGGMTIVLGLTGLVSIVYSRNGRRRR